MAYLITNEKLKIETKGTLIALLARIVMLSLIVNGLYSNSMIMTMTMIMTGT